MTLRTFVFITLLIYLFLTVFPSSFRLRFSPFGARLSPLAVIAVFFASAAVAKIGIMQQRVAAIRSWLRPSLDIRAGGSCHS